MRIQFTDNGNTYTIETISSFAKYLAEKISDRTAKPGKTKLVADFALTSYNKDCEITIPEVLSDVRRGGGFYGVKELGEIGFNSTNRQFAFDYYGGQHLRICDFDESYMNKDDAEWKISEILNDIFDTSTDNYLLLVQWNEDECLKKDEEEAARAIQQYEVVEVCPECGAENIITWDVEKDGYVAYCPHCGSKMMLCDECLHADDAKVCDWCACRGCYRERQNKKN